MGFHTHFQQQTDKRLSWSETMLYASMLLMSVTLPISWRLGLFSMIIMMVAAVVNAVAKRRIVNKPVLSGVIVSYALMGMFWIIWFASAFWSSNQANAWHVVGVKLPFLLIPLVFVIGDTTFLTRRHIKMLFMALCVTLMVRLIVMIFRAIIVVLQGGTLMFSGELQFDPLHHNYLALYLLTAIAFLYSEIVSPRSERLFRLPVWTYFAIIVAFIAYIVVIASRSGLVVLALLGVACVAHATICRRLWKTTGIVVAALVIAVVASYVVFPNLYYRIMCTIRNLVSGNSGNDVRLLMDGCGLQVFHTSPWFGVGCGDVWQMLQQVFVENGFEEGSVRDFDSHNQYLETLMATGIVGMVLQVAMMVAPVVAALKARRGRLIICLLTIVFAGCIFFEATFGRQMGLLFIVWWMCVAVANLRIEQIENSVI